MTPTRHLSLVLLLATSASGSAAVEYQDLPDALTALDGTAITTPEAWRSRRRPELLEIFRREMHGRFPVERPASLTFTEVKRNATAMGGKATMKYVHIGWSGPGGTGGLDLTLFIPNFADAATRTPRSRPAPGIIKINNNKSIQDPDATSWGRSWEADLMVDRGYAAAAFFYGDVDPDSWDNFQNGVHGVIDTKPRAGDAWGTIAAWGWGASRILDYIETDPDLDENRFAVVGHSRGGKASLWAGASDERFALSISNDSGCSGAAISRGKGGESVESLNGGFPHWFNGNYKGWNGRAWDMPFDQHELIALMAPRLVYVASGQDDSWADPNAEYRGARFASPVWQRIWGVTGLFPDAERPTATPAKPPLEQPFHTGRIGHHMRPGGHALMTQDWNYFMDYMDRHLKNLPRPTVSVTATTGSIGENSPTPGLFTISRTGSTLTALSVALRPGGTATAGIDYQALPERVSIPAGLASVTIPVQTLIDTEADDIESVTLAIIPLGTYAVGTAQATMAITDSPAVAIIATEPHASEAGPVTGAFTITRSGSTAASLSVALRSSGSATAGVDHEGLPATVIIPAGSAGALVRVTPTADDLSEGDETVELAIVPQPAYGISTANAVVTIADALPTDAPPVVGIIATVPDAAEAGPVPGTMTIVRSGAVTAPLTVGYTLSGSARAGTDYVHPGSQITIPAGAASVTLPITPIPDGVVEADETVIVSLAARSAYVIGTAARATCAIADGPLVLPVVTVSATDPIATEPVSGTASDTGTIAVQRTGDTSQPLTVSFWAEGSAGSGDYAAIGRSVTIPAGANMATITVTPKADALDEIGEALTLNLQTGSTYVIGEPSRATVAILDAPGTPATGSATLAIVATDPWASEGGGPDTARLRVSRTGSTAKAVTVPYTVGGDATAGTDYLALPGSITIPAGSATADIVITPKTDADWERRTQVVTVTLSDVTGHAVGPRSAAAFIQDAPRVSVAVVEGQASEAGPDEGLIRIVRTGTRVDSQLTVQVAVTGSATPGTDHQTIASQMTIPANSYEVLVPVRPIADTDATEGPETVVVTLVPKAHYAIGTASGTVTIADATALAPVITSQPMACTVPVGAPASFAVTTMGLPAPTYQWQRDGVAIAGATSARYTIPATTGAQHGATYRCLVRNNVGSTTSTAAMLTVTGIGWQGTYYDAPGFSGVAVARLDPAIAFDWKAGAPMAHMGVDRFSVRWRGLVTPAYSQTYTFTATCDDGVRVWVDGRRLIDRWIDQGATSTSGAINLAAGIPALVVMEYYEAGGNASARLDWQSASQARQTITDAWVRPAPGDDLPGGWTTQEVGDALAGTTTEDAGRWTITGAGADIWNQADGCRFTWQRLTGDWRITVRILSLDPTHPWAKVGIMARESLDADSRHAFTCTTPANGTAFQRRLTTAGASIHTAGPRLASPCWLRLERLGSTCIGSASADGATWTEIRRETIAFGNALHAGIAVTSHDATTLATAIVDAVQILGGTTISN